MLGARRQSQPAKPRGHRLAMAEMPRRPDIAEQLRPGQDATLEEARFEHRDLPVRHQDVHREVDHAVVAGIVNFRAADEGAAPHVARRQAAARRLGVGARDGGDGHAQVTGQVTVRREFRPRPQRAILHILVDGVGNHAVLGPATSLEPWQPHCHRRNIWNVMVLCNLIVIQSAGARDILSPSWANEFFCFS